MLVNVPLRNQLNEPTTDGGPDEAKDANCVPASLGAAVSALSGQIIYGDALRDLIYPETYTGATNPVDYIPILKSRFGITMTEFDSSDGHALVSRVIASLQAHQPVSAAIPSMWGNSYVGQDMVHFAGGTHEVTFCDYSATNGTLTAMNPWPEPPTNDAFYQTQPTEWWAERLVYGRVFPMSGGGGTPSMSSVTPVWNAAASTLAYPAHDGIPAITLDHGQAYYATTNRVGAYPLSAPSYDPSGDSVVLWNDGRASRAVKANNWAIVLEDSGPRLAALLTSLSAEAGAATTLSQQNAALKQQLADAQSQVKTVTATVSALQAQVAHLTAEVSALQAQVMQLQQQGGAAGSGGSNATALAAVHAALAALQQAVADLDQPPPPPPPAISASGATVVAPLGVVRALSLPDAA